MKQSDLEAFMAELPRRFAVKVTPKAAANKLVAERDEAGAWLIKAYVTTVPEDGKANEAVIKLLAKELDIKKSALTIISGLTSRHKIIALE